MARQDLRTAMGHRTFFCAALAGASILAFASPPAAAQLFDQTGPPEPGQVRGTAARLTLETAYKDLGRIPDTTPVRLKFDFRNTGSEMLVVDKIDSACGCTVPELSIREYLPGERGTVEVVFDPRQRPGKQNRVITVHSNDGSSLLTTINFDVEVYEVVRPDPRGALNVGRLIHGEGGSHTMTLVSEREKFKINQIDMNGPYLTSEIVGRNRVELSDGTKQHQVTVKFTVDPEAPRGWLDRRVVFNIVVSDEAGEKDVEHTVPYFVNAHVGGRIEARPERVSFGAPAAGAPLEREIRIHSIVDQPFNITAVRIESLTDLDLKATYERHEVDGHPIWIVRVTGTAPQQPGGFNGTIFVTTDVPGEPEIAIQFFGTVRPALGTTAPRPFAPIGGDDLDDGE